jgi:hypothetical protein
MPDTLVRINPPMLMSRPHSLGFKANYATKLVWGCHPLLLKE